MLPKKRIIVRESFNNRQGGGVGTLGISGWGCAAGTLEPLIYTRTSSSKICYIRVNSPNSPYPKVAVSLV